MVVLSGSFGGWLGAGGWGCQLQEVLTAAELCGAGDYCLLPTQQVHCGGPVGALPAASALLILHGAELVMVWASVPRLVGEPLCLGF